MWLVLRSFGSVISVVCLPSGYCVTKTGFCSVESDPCPPCAASSSHCATRQSRTRAASFFFLFSKASGSTLRPTQPPSLREPEIFVGRCWSCRETDYWPPYIAHAKNAWSYTLPNFCSFHVFFCVVLCILCCFMYCLFCVVLCIVCVYMCTELLPPGGYPIAVKYISYHIISCTSSPPLT